MNRAMPVIVVAALIALAVPPATHAGSTPTPGRPPGVNTTSWVPIAHGFGAVVERRLPDRDMGGAPLPSSLGYFVLWRDGHWLRLDSLVMQAMALRSPPAASQWIVLGGNLRFVIERQMPGQPMRDQAAGQSALGYFAIQRNGQWLRLVPDPPGALYRGPLRSETSRWLPISGNLRFVVEQQAPERDAGAGELPSVLGYFVGKRDGHWLRLGSRA